MTNIAAFILMAFIIGGCEKEYDLTGYEMEILQPGSGPAVGRFDSVLVSYVGRFPNGEKFDSSQDRGGPKKYAMRSPTLIDGWKVGLLGMKVGEKRRLTIPPHLAFGSQGKGRIPPNATVVFDISLIAIE